MEGCNIRFRLKWPPSVQSFLKNTLQEKFSMKKKQVLIECIVFTLTPPHSISYGNEPKMCVPLYPIPTLQEREGFQLAQQYKEINGAKRVWALSGKRKGFHTHHAPLACMKAWLRCNTITATQKCLEGFFFLEALQIYIARWEQSLSMDCFLLTECLPSAGLPGHWHFGISGL